MERPRGPATNGGANTHNINALVPGNTNLGALRTEINTDNRHCGLTGRFYVEGERVGGRMKRKGSEKGTELLEGRICTPLHYYYWRGGK